ncbi:MAG: HXXEE domain-containing protein [Calothrix sp. MO_167.B12]|nr:HXXEE domain-containing protein [Calothrix sp. MO_167.B12]
MLGNQLTKITQSYWVLGLAQVIHSMEETYTELYLRFGSMSEALHKIFPWIPQFAISADIFAILNYLMIALILGSIPAAEKGSRLGFIFMWSWAIIELLNGAFHIGTWIFLRTYFPGGVSGPILFVLSLVFIQQLRNAGKQTTQAIQ